MDGRQQDTSSLIRPECKILDFLPIPKLRRWKQVWDEDSGPCRYQTTATWNRNPFFKGPDAYGKDVRIWSRWEYRTLLRFNIPLPCHRLPRPNVNTHSFKVSKIGHGRKLMRIKGVISIFKFESSIISRRGIVPGLTWYQSPVKLLLSSSPWTRNLKTDEYSVRVCKIASTESLALANDNKNIAIQSPWWCV